MKTRIFKSINGFTLIELVITIAIFAAMTTYLLAKYGKFNQTILLTNLAYDVALTIRTAQSYGLNVKAAASGLFNSPFGAHFNKSSSTKSCFIFFADINSDKVYSDTQYCTTGGSVTEKISSYSIKRGSFISELCAGDDENDCDSTDTLDITFKRPDPDAIIMNESDEKKSYARITLLATDGSEKNVIVRSTGQIAITN